MRIATPSPQRTHAPPSVNGPFTLLRKHGLRRMEPMTDMIRTGAILRSTLPILLATACAAQAADLPVHRRYPPPPQVYGAAPPPPPVYVEDPPLISPPTTPILPGSSTLPGYYGRPFDYYYQGAYYGGGPYPSYFWRLPYACGVYGYC